MVIVSEFAKITVIDDDTDDYVPIIQDQTGTPLNKIITVDNFRADIDVRGTQTIWASSGAWVTRTTNGATYATLELPTNDVMLVSFNFNTATSQGVGLWWQPPPNYNAGTIRFRPIWTAASGSGTVIFSLSGRSYADSDAIDQDINTGVQTSTDTLITANDIHIGPYSSAITLNGGVLAGEPVYLEIRRDISDTLGVDAKLIGIEIEYTISSPTAT